jgi:hypothetical protein
MEPRPDLEENRSYRSSQDPILKALGTIDLKLAHLNYRLTSLEATLHGFVFNQGVVPEEPEPPPNPELARRVTNVQEVKNGDIKIIRLTLDDNTQVKLNVDLETNRVFNPEVQNQWGDVLGFPSEEQWNIIYAKLPQYRPRMTDPDTFDDNALNEDQ